MTFVDLSTQGGYEVCFADASFHAKDWTAGHFIGHIINLRNNSPQNGVLLTTESIEKDGIVEQVKVFEHHPAYKEIPSRTEWTLWVVRYS